MKTKIQFVALSFALAFSAGFAYSQNGTVAANRSITNASSSNTNSHHKSADTRVGTKTVSRSGEKNQSQLHSVVPSGNTMNALNISPVKNPVQYDLLVRIESDISENGSYRIYGPTGLLVADKSITIPKGFSIVMLDDKGSRMAGLYVVELTTPERSARTKVFRVN